MSFTFNSSDTSAWSEQYPGEILAFLLEHLTLEKEENNRASLEQMI